MRETIAPAATLHALLAARARQWPDRLALQEKRRGVWTGWSWAELARCVQSFAWALHARGFATGDRLIVMGEASVAWIVADLAAQSLGGASVTPSPDMPNEDLAVALRDAGARFAAVDGVEAASRVAAVTSLDPAGFFLLRPEAGALGDSVLAVAERGRTLPDGVARDPLETATVAFGRDDTGRLSLATLSHDAILRKASALIERLALGDSAHALVQVPLACPAERVSALAVLLAGGRLSFPERADTVGVDLGEARPNLLSALPWQWRDLRRDVEKRLQGAPRAVLAVWARRMKGGGGFSGKLLAASLRRRLGLASVTHALAQGGALEPEDMAFLGALGLDLIESDGPEADCGWSRLRRTGGAWTELGGAARALEDAGRGHAVSR